VNRYGGKQVRAFEQAFATRAGVKRCVATNSGTSALYTCLGALGIGPGDEVYSAAVHVHRHVQRHHAELRLPIYVDVDLETSQIDADKIAAADHPEHARDLPGADRRQCRGHGQNLRPFEKAWHPLIEDACQYRTLAEWRGRIGGQLGLAGCFSFLASKNLNCGDGGAIITNDAELAIAARASTTRSRNNGPANVTAVAAAVICG